MRTVTSAAPMYLIIFTSEMLQKLQQSLEFYNMHTHPVMQMSRFLLKYLHAHLFESPFFVGVNTLVTKNVQLCLFQVPNKCGACMQS